MASRNYRDLIAWQRAMDLVVAAYDALKSFPRHEQFALCNQIQRAVVSIASNIAEGQGRGSNAEFVRFLRIAHGSLRELETQFLISQRLGYLEEIEVGIVLALTEEVGRLLNGLIRSKV